MPKRSGRAGIGVPHPSEGYGALSAGNCTSIIGRSEGALADGWAAKRSTRDMMQVMTPPKATSPAASLPEALRPLAAQLANLPRDARERVISAARAANTTRHGYPTISWSSLMSAKGVVSLGGNAVEDTDALYDG
jgi:hypothetical protein